MTRYIIMFNLKKQWRQNRQNPIKNMKTRYFTPDNIETKSKEIIDSLNIKKNRIKYFPENSALLILDMQKYFLQEKSHAFIPGASAIVTAIKRLADAYLNRDLPVIITRHINSDENAGVMAEWWEDIIREEDELSTIIPELDLKGTVVINKSQYDAFYKTRLDNILKINGVKQLVITGVMTHLCCETTARSAFVQGFQVFFPVDGTATYNEEFHRASFLNLSHGFAVPVLTEELLKYL
ncbi:isochorismatase family protein [candidate division KSB1 bacterium]